MIREVDLVSYLPPFMQIYKEPAAALEAENPEFLLAWEATDRAQRNRFISSADEYGIGRFEKMLGIYPSENDTLESRRSRVQNAWFNKTPYTYRVLLEKLEVLCRGTGFEVSYDFSKDYTLNVTTALEMYGQIETLYNALLQMLPENIVINIINKLDMELYAAHAFAGVVAVSESMTIESGD